MDFTEWTLEEFNRMLDTNILPTDTFAESVDKIDEAEASYFYLSMNKKDLIDAINAERVVFDLLGCNLIFVKEICLFIATY
jgi:hypothetical protein